MTLVWTYSLDETQAEVTGRQRWPLSKKLNPVWWIGNDVEQSLNDGTTDWYMPGEPEWKRWLYWQFRNPLQNFRAFVAGVQDKNYKVKGRAPVYVVQRDDIPGQSGWQWHILYGGDLKVPAFFICWTGFKPLDFYFGWQPSGFFGAKGFPGFLICFIPIAMLVWSLWRY